MDLDANFLQLPLSCSGKKILFKSSCIHIMIQISTKILSAVASCTSHPVNIFIKLCWQLFDLSCAQTNTQRQKHDIVSGCNNNNRYFFYKCFVSWEVRACKKHPNIQSLQSVYPSVPCRTISRERKCITSWKLAGGNSVTRITRDPHLEV